MSRIGRQPVAVPAGVEVKIAENKFCDRKRRKREHLRKRYRQRCQSN